MHSVSVTITYQQLIDIANENGVYLSPEQARELLDDWGCKLRQCVVNTAQDVVLQVVENYKEER